MTARKTVRKKASAKKRPAPFKGALAVMTSKELLAIMGRGGVHHCRDGRNRFLARGARAIGAMSHYEPGSWSPRAIYALLYGKTGYGPMLHIRRDETESLRHSIYRIWQIVMCVEARAAAARKDER